MALRSAIQDFALANPLYAGATVTFYAVDNNGTQQPSLVTLYSDPSTLATVSNPQVLDGEGKFAAPVYISASCIGVVSGLANVASHTTGVIVVCGERTQRAVASVPTILATDQIINMNIAAPGNVALPPSVSRGGAPLTFKDAGGQAFANPITLFPNGAETIDGAASFQIDINHMAVTLVPYNDGTNIGWAVE